MVAGAELITWAEVDVEATTGSAAVGVTGVQG